MLKKLNLGSGDVRIPGFTNVDKYDKTADIPADITDLPFEAGTVDEIVCYQVIEHIPYQLSSKVFEEMYRVLKPGGTAIIETPDIDVVCAAILTDGLQDKWIYNLVGQYHRPWDKGRYDDWDNVAAAIHRNPWNLERVKRFAEPLGFLVETIPYEQMVSKFEENLACRLTKPQS